MMATGSALAFALPPFGSAHSATVRPCCAAGDCPIAALMVNASHTGKPEASATISFFISVVSPASGLFHPQADTCCVSYCPPRPGEHDIECPMIHILRWGHVDGYRCCNGSRTIERD